MSYYVYLDWNIFNKIEKIGELDISERDFYTLIENLIITGKIIIPYSNAHINDIHRGYLNNPNFIEKHLSTINRLTNNLCIVQYWGEKQSRWHYRDPQEFLDSTITETDLTAKSFSQLLSCFDDPLINTLFDIKKATMQLTPLPENFSQLYKVDPFFSLIFPRSKTEMNFSALCEDLYDFSFKIKKDFILYKNFRKLLNQFRVKFPRYIKLTQVAQNKIIGEPTQLTWDDAWEQVKPEFKESSNPAYDKIVNLFITTDLKGYRQDEKFANLIDDALHTFYAAHCNYFITRDGRCFDKAKKIYQQLKVCNYSVPNLAISDNACKTFCPDLIVVSITDLKMANVSAPSSDLNWPDIFCFTLTFRMALSDPLLSGGILGWYKK
jgi:hypothetical protein